MLEKLKTLVKESKLVQFLLVAFISAAAGALLYPTKHIEETYKEHYEQELSKQKEVYEKKISDTKESYDKELQSSRQEKLQLDAKLASLTIEIHTLQSKQKTAKFKIVRPDGTIEEKEFTSSETNETNQMITQIQQEFKVKVDSIEQKWEKVHKERVAKLQQEFASKEKDYQKTIHDLEETKVVDINKKSGALEVGMLSNGNAYIHPTYDLFGPFFVGAQAQGPVSAGTGNGFAAGAGVGIRF
jgi:hypothetical protein